MRRKKWDRRRLRPQPKFCRPKWRIERAWAQEIARIADLLLAKIGLP